MKVTASLPDNGGSPEVERRRRGDYLAIRENNKEEKKEKKREESAGDTGGKVKRGNISEAIPR